jgi:murein L,D-transpeptidase YcbB/YkuD
VLSVARLAIIALALFPVLPVAAAPAADIAVQVQGSLHPLYEARQFAPLWLGDDGRPTARAAQALQLVAQAADDALDPADYQLAALQQQHDRLAQHAGSDSEQAAFDLALSRTLARYLEHLSIGRVAPRSVGQDIDLAPQLARLPQHLQQVLTAGDLPAAVATVRPQLPPYAALRQLLPAYRALAAQHPHGPALPPLPGRKLEPGQPWPGLAALADWLTILGDLPAGTPLPAVYDGALVEAVKRFQARHALASDGVIGKQTYEVLQVPLPARVRQIELAMERLRWMDDHVVQGRYLVINIPQFTLWAYTPAAAGPQVALTMPVVVGIAGKNETPVMTKTLSSLVFSPYWNVPRSIATKEIIPKLRKDPAYLVHEDMELVGSNGVHGSHAGPDEINGIIMGDYRIRQRPGEKNALGGLKFVFPNDDNIYMHDTPSKRLFAKDRRDFSHGCVRLGNPMGLALFALQTQGEWDEAKVNAKIAASTDQHLALKERMPVLLMYFTANVADDGSALFPQDIYQQDATLAAALNDHAQ